MFKFYLLIGMQLDKTQVILLLNHMICYFHTDCVLELDFRFPYNEPNHKSCPDIERDVAH
jgi:hypothetical protein